MAQTHPRAAIALPVAERRRAHDFYVDVLGLEPVGPRAEDGLPEPLTLRVNDGLALVLIPRGGFGYGIGGRPVAEHGHECVLCVERGSEDEVRALVERARAAGAGDVTDARAVPWGFEGLFADPDGHLWTVRLG